MLFIAYFWGCIQMSRTYLLFKHVLEIPKDCRKQCPLDKTFSHSQVEKDTSIWMWFEFQNNTFSLHIHSSMSWLFKKTLEWDCWFEFSYLHLAKILKSDEILDCPCIKLLLIRYSLKCLLTSSDCPNVLKVNWSKIEIASHNACHQIWKKESPSWKITLCCDCNGLCNQKERKTDLD